YEMSAERYEELWRTLMCNQTFNGGKPSIDFSRYFRDYLDIHGLIMPDSILGAESEEVLNPHHITVDIRYSSRRLRTPQPRRTTGFWEKKYGEMRTFGLKRESLIAS